MKEKGLFQKSVLLLLSFLLAFLPGFQIQAAEGQRAAIANPTYTLKSTQNTNVSTKANPNETTVLIFGYIGCSKTRSTLNSLSSCNWVKRSDIRVIFAETSGKNQEEVKAYETGYQCPDITFCYREDDIHFKIMAAYGQLFGLSGGSYPTIVLIDQNNNIQNLLTGTKTSNEILAEIKKFADVDDSGTTTDPSGEGFENIVYGLNSIDGSVVSTKANPNETTVLIFGYTTCGNTKATLRDINQSSWVSRDDIRVIFADVYGAMLDETQAFAQNYSGNGIIFCHDESFLNYNLALTYLNLIKETGGTFPYIVLIDKNNRVRSITLGPKTADEIISEINKITTPAQPEHEWETEYTVDKEPTCTTAGSKSIHCKHCDATKDSVPIPATGHNMQATAAKAATCTENGNSAYWFCSACRKYFADAAGNQETTLANTVIKANGHKFGEWQTVTAPTCSNPGSRKRVCTACGHSETGSMEPTGHAWNTDYTVDKEPTCTTAGSKSIHCKHCDATKDSVSIPASGHNMQATAAKAATCTENGNSAYWFCSACRKYFADASGNQEITLANTVIKATGHKFGEWQTVTSPTCTEPGSRKRVCTACGHSETGSIAPTGHEWGTDYTVDKEPTCTTAGSKSIHCKHCDATKDSVPIPATGHNMQATVAKAATCTENGNTAYWFCSICKKYFADASGNQETTLENTVIKAVGHKFGEWQIITSPTCTDSGSRQRICSVCGHTETGSIAPTGHEWNTDYTVDKEPTCTDDGSKSIHCKHCDATKDSVSIPASGHSFGEWQIITSPTCGNSGSRQRQCSVCGYIETDGIDITGHDWETDYRIDKEPTCTAAGSKSIHCKNCDATKDSVSIPASGHSFGEWQTVTAPTCTDSGSRQRACSVCGHTETDSIAPTGHEWNTDYTVDNEPTCTDDGSKSIHCKHCDATKDSLSIPASGHNMQTTAAKDASCTENGNTAYWFCTACRKYFADADGNQETTLENTVIKATGHKFGEWQTVTAPTCTDSGSRQRVCTACGHSETDSIAPTGHEWNTDYTVDKEPTCTDDGSKSIHCRHCDATKDSLSILASGHNFGKWQTVTSPTCTDSGSRQRACSACGHTETGSITPIGHAWNTDYTVDKEATCTASGSRSIHCRHCDATKDSVSIPASGHTYKTTVSKATMKKNGRLTKICTACGHSAGSSIVYCPSKISLSETSYIYNGKQKRPKVTITDSKGKKISSANYTVSYSKNQSVGTATVKIRWKGYYSGTASKSFTIRPKGTSLAKVTASAKRLTVKWKKQDAQISGYEVQYSTSKDFPKKSTITKTAKKTSAQTLAVKDFKTNHKKAAKKCYVRIRTYKTVNGKKYYSKWSGVKSASLKN